VSPDEIFRRDRDEPLGLWQQPGSLPEGMPGLRAVAFEFSSRGDRVPGRLLLPAEGDGPLPLVLLQHGANGSKDSPYLGPIAAPWVRAGTAVATIDFPLHGERANPKLGGLVRAALGLEGRSTPSARAVLEEFMRQAVVDLARAVDALAALPRADAGRLAYAGLSLGAIVGATYCALDPRPRAAALALGGGGFGGPEVDPVKHVRRIAPRPLLFVNMNGDETVPRAATEALYDAAGEPKEILWFEGRHQELPGRALKAIWRFLHRSLQGAAPQQSWATPEGRG
jgi:dienelactone hydrolase